VEEDYLLLNDRPFSISLKNTAVVSIREMGL